MKTLLLILLIVLTFAYVANTAPVISKKIQAEIQDLLNVLSIESDTDNSSSYDDSQSNDDDDNDSDEGAGDIPPPTYAQAANEYNGQDSLAQLSKIRADIQDLLNALSMQFVADESSSYDDDSQSDNEHDDGAGDLPISPRSAQGEDEYYRPDNLALLQAMQSALFENLPVKTRPHLLAMDYIMKTLPNSPDLNEHNEYPEDNNQAQKETKSQESDRLDLDNDDYDSVEVAKAAQTFISSLPEIVSRAQFLS